MRHRHSSSTARLIARCTLLAARDPSLLPLVPVDALEPLTAMLRADGGITWFDHAVRHRWSRAILRWLESKILPGIIVHFIARKRWIEDAVTAALDGGCTQLVVIGAGLDTLAWRLHRARTGVTFWELDHPASQLPKADAFKGLASGDNLILAPLDLRTELPSEVLGRDARFNRRGKTCFVAEGLLMYLPESRVLAVLADLAQMMRSEVVCTFMEPDATGRAAFRGGSPVIEKWLQSISEPFAWAISRGKLSDFVAPTGLHVRSIAGTEALRAEVLRPVGLEKSALAAGECLGILSGIP
jgi:methyltransferase (TIGR00027 family)